MDTKPDDVVNRSNKPNRYLNPVYPHSSADPFVLRYLNEYWCYSTGFCADGRCFGVFHSLDLVDWQEFGSVMDPIDDCSSCYWAPEVSYNNGRFLMYYAVGDGEKMQIRVAVAEHPTGPFLDAGKSLTSDDFAIDPHVFEDDDGMRYLFYATDFLAEDRVGTGTVCDRMLDPFTLEGNPWPVTRARYDWQVFDPQRAEKGGVRWHTVEGPFVLKHKGIYYQMFSAGNWQNNSYGVSYAISDRVTASDWKQVADGELILPVLRSIPGKVFGPGHNSVVYGPDLQQPFCVYHRWSDDSGARILAIDRMDWVGERILVVGPTTTPQPAPLASEYADFFADCADADLEKRWEPQSGAWAIRSRAVVQESTAELAVLRTRFAAASFIAEVSLRLLDTGSERAEIGIGLNEHAGHDFSLEIVFANDKLMVSRHCSSEGGFESVDHASTLPAEFDARSYHLLRLEVNGSRVRVAVDGKGATWTGRLKKQPHSLSLLTRHTAGAFCGFALTSGWEDLFDGEETNPAALDWTTTDHDHVWQVSDQRLLYDNLDSTEAVITKGPLFESYELLVNVRFDSEPESGGYYGLIILAGNESAIRLKILRGSSCWQLHGSTPHETAMFPLPDSFDAFNYQQFRIRQEVGVLTIQYEDRILGEISTALSATHVGLCRSAAAASFETVRVTAIVV
jgi:GH43 family beta-xylosidase